MADEKEILDLIKTAARMGSVELDLSNKGISSLPKQISKLPNLERLNLSENQLTSLPPELFKLTNLKILDLSLNQLAILPTEIGKLKNLIRLELWSNELTNVPPELAQLTNLFYLELGGNQLTSVPPEIGQLKNLTSLELWTNKLTSVPAELAQLTDLAYLDIGRNQLTSVPPQLAELTNVTYLNLGRNQLTSVPPQLAQLTNVTIIDLGRNQLTSVPSELTRLTSLTYLDLSGNQLTNVPSELTQLTNLAYLDLRDNQLPVSPEALKDPRDVKSIFAAIKGLITGERLNEAKILVVGDGDVGKSSVVEQLVHGTFNPAKQTTLGVEITDEMRVVHSDTISDGQPIKLNIWDFGGQEIQHSTHQFFLTTRSLYLLVVDARKGDQLTNVEYWLKLIESFGGGSPIIIVVNQIDQLKGQRPLNLDRKALQEKYNIKEFVETSCETGEGISALSAAIGREVGQMKHVRDLWPRDWLAIKRRLKELSSDYIPVESYFQICRDENLNDPDQQQSLLDLLHVLGTVIRFPGDTQVLKPRWVTQGVYGLLTSKKLVADQGRFDLKDVGEILAGLPDGKEHYPVYTHERLIRVMRHFELCFEFTDRAGNYLIPRHLHDNEPNVPWDDEDALKFQYHYETLPDSVISRFIVRMNQNIARDHRWKNGVFLSSGKGDENLAKVKADLVDRRIYISVNGKEQTRRAFLAVIRSAFDGINSNFKIEIAQKIPVPGHPQVLVSYQDLLAYEEENEREVFIPELRKRFSVRELLDGIEDLSTRMERREGENHRRGGAARFGADVQQQSQLRLLRIVVGSPADVQAERDLLPSVIEEVNRTVGADRGVHLVMSRWETDSHPGFHADGPQGLIAPILNITDCDLLIGIFWKRFGTQAADGMTGTEHEFKLAHESWVKKQTPQIFVYFNEKSYTPKSKAETDQWGRVLEFKEKFPKEGLWWPYKGKTQFEKLARNHLVNYVRGLA